MKYQPIGGLHFVMMDKVTDKEPDQMLLGDKSYNVMKHSPNYEVLLMCEVEKEAYLYYTNKGLYKLEFTLFDGSILRLETVIKDVEVKSEYRNYSYNEIVPVNVFKGNGRGYETRYVNAIKFDNVEIPVYYLTGDVRKFTIIKETK